MGNCGSSDLPGKHGLAGTPLSSPIPATTSPQNLPSPMALTTASDLPPDGEPPPASGTPVVATPVVATPVAATPVVVEPEASSAKNRSETSYREFQSESSLANTGLISDEDMSNTLVAISQDHGIDELKEEYRTGIVANDPAPAPFQQRQRRQREGAKPIFVRMVSSDGLHRDEVARNWAKEHVKSLGSDGDIQHQIMAKELKCVVAENKYDAFQVALDEILDDYDALINVKQKAPSPDSCQESPQAPLITGRRGSMQAVVDRKAKFARHLSSFDLDPADRGKCQQWFKGHVAGATDGNEQSVQILKELDDIVQAEGGVETWAEGRLEADGDDGQVPTPLSPQRNAVAKRVKKRNERFFKRHLSTESIPFEAALMTPEMLESLKPQNSEPAAS